MIVFCPTCGNMLLVEITEVERQLQYSCQTCPYVYRISRRITRNAQLVRKQLDDVMSAEDAFKGKEKTQVPCPKCQHDEAYFHMQQTRSADEPATRFYACARCRHVWKEDM